MLPRAFQRDSAELVLLAVLAGEPLYGYAIAKEVAARSGGELRLTPGVMYPLLARLERDGLVTASWEVIRSDRGKGVEEPAAGDDEEAPGGRRRKWYRLSAKGRKRLAATAATHRSYVAMIRAFLPTGGGAERREEAAG